MNGLNPAQDRAARSPRDSLFVAAGAGSGKTRALAWRYANAVERGGPRAADAAVAITFTEKAAGELAERIRRVLLERGDLEAARSVDAGWISTIHGFCSRIVRRHAFELGIDPSFSIASEVEEAQIREGAFESAARALSATDEAVADLVAAYGARGVRSACLEAMGRMRALAMGAEDLLMAEPPVLKDVVTTAVRGFRASERGFGSLPSRTKTVCGNEDACRQAAEALEAIEFDDPAAAERARSIAQGASVAARGSDDVKDECAAAREVATALARGAAAVEVASHQAAFVRLVGGLDHAYATEKGSRGLLDYDDLLLLAARLFDERPEIARVYAERFDAVMVDEYQDTDPVQASIVEQVAPAGLCTVGDEQQAIYGFRYADVDVFRARAAHAAPDETVSLDTNYRSHPDILRFVNAAFGTGTLLGDGFLELSAGRADDGPGWVAGRPRVRVLAVDKAEWPETTPRDVETAVVAGSIVGRLEAGCPPDDIAVLLRTMTHADAYVDALRGAGVPTFVESGTSLLDCPEARAVLAAARVVANVHDEEALLGLLAGPLGGLGDDALMWLAVASRSAGSLWSGTRELASSTQEDAGRAAELLELLDELRARRGRMPLDRLITAIAERTDLDLALAARGPEGERALAGIYRMARLAGGYERSSGDDITGFIEHLALREEHARREPSVASGAAGAGAVRLMTIHASKGLEFPFVIVPECGREIPWPSTAILTGRMGSGLQTAFVAPAIPEMGLERGRTESWEGVRDAMRERDLAEERRILYVACTRARDALLVTGTSPLSDAPRETAIDWLAAALEECGNPAGVELETLRCDSAPPVASAWCPTDSGEAASLTAVDRAARSDPALARPPSVSYSALNDLARCPYRFYVSRIAGLGATPPGGAAAFGTAVHAALSLGSDEAPTAERLFALARTHGLPPADAERLQSTVEGFLRSPDLARAREMDTISQEVPFVIPVGDVTLTGTLDVLARTSDRALVVDYKTGSLPTPPPGSAGHPLQAACYGLAGFAGGADCVEVVFVQPDGDRLAFVFDADAKAALISEIEEAIGAMLGEEFEPLSRFDARLCPGCPAYRSICPVVGPSAVPSAR